MISLGLSDYGLGIYGQSVDVYHWVGHAGFESEDWTYDAGRPRRCRG